MSVSVREEVIAMVSNLPMPVLEHLKGYIKSLVYDDEGVLSDEAVAAIDAYRSGRVTMCSNEEARRRLFPEERGETVENSAKRRKTA